MDSLFAELPAQAPTQAAPPIEGTCPLNDLADPEQRLFVTLHCLFPNELLPALDLLDRQLVTRFDTTIDEPDGRGHEHAVYYVRSAQVAPRSRSRYHQGGGGVTGGSSYYEVRLSAWNCSCPAFSFAAFGNGNHHDHAGPDVEEARTSSHDPASPSPPSGFGGFRRGQGMSAMCKHLMACFLADGCCRGLLGRYVIRKLVSREELAGWAAGWGE